MRLLTFHLPLMKHRFAEQRLDYQLIKLLNANGSKVDVMKSQSLFFIIIIRRIIRIFIHTRSTQILITTVYR